MLQIPTAKGTRATKDNLATDCILLSDLIVFKDNIAIVLKFVRSIILVVMVHIKKMTWLDLQRQEPGLQSLDLSSMPIIMQSVWFQPIPIRDLHCLTSPRFLFVVS